MHLKRYALSLNFGHRLEQCYSGVVYAMLRSLGHGECVASDGPPLRSGTAVVWAVHTFSGHRDEHFDDHESLRRWTGLLARISPSGHVLIYQPNDSPISHMGELFAEMLKLRGVVRVVTAILSPATDVACSVGFRLFVRYFTPRDIVGRWIPYAFEPIEIGGVTIHTDDYFIVNRDGVVIIPSDLPERVRIDLILCSHYLS